MEITEEQYQRVEHLFPIARGRVKLSNLAVLNAVLYLAEQGCQGRGLPESFGPWHAVYMRWQRWNERGLLARVFAELPELRLPAESWAVLGLDSASVKVHPDATGAPKKGAASPGPIPRRAEHQGARNGRGRPPRPLRVTLSPGQALDGGGRAEAVGRAGAAGAAGLSADGSGLRGGCPPPAGPGTGLLPGSAAAPSPQG